MASDPAPLWLHEFMTDTVRDAYELVGDFLWNAVLTEGYWRINVAPADPKERDVRVNVAALFPLFTDPKVHWHSGIGFPDALHFEGKVGDHDLWLSFTETHEMWREPGQNRVNAR